MLCQGLTLVMPQLALNEFGFSRCGSSYPVLAQTLQTFFHVNNPYTINPNPLKKSIGER